LRATRRAWEQDRAAAQAEVMATLDELLTMAGPPWDRHG
jgi:hypothetical protein